MAKKAGMLLQDVGACAVDAQIIAAALAAAKRRPPREVPVALDRLLTRLTAMAGEVAARDREAEAAEQAIELEQIEKRKLLREIAQVRAEAEHYTARPRSSGARSSTARKPGKAKGKEPRLPTIAEVCTMLEASIALHPDAKLTLPDLAKRWLTDERRYRTQLRNAAKLGCRRSAELLMEREPEWICRPARKERMTTEEARAAYLAAEPSAARKEREEKERQARENEAWRAGEEERELERLRRKVLEAKGIEVPDDAAPVPEESAEDAPEPEVVSCWDCAEILEPTTTVYRTIDGERTPFCNECDPGEEEPDESECAACGHESGFHEDDGSCSEDECKCTGFTNPKDVEEASHAAA